MSTVKLTISSLYQVPALALLQDGRVQCVPRTQTNQVRFLDFMPFYLYYLIT